MSTYTTIINPGISWPFICHLQQLRALSTEICWHPPDGLINSKCACNCGHPLTFPLVPNLVHNQITGHKQNDVSYKTALNDGAASVMCAPPCVCVSSPCWCIRSPLPACVIGSAQQWWYWLWLRAFSHEHWVKVYMWLGFVFCFLLKVSVA